MNLVNFIDHQKIIEFGQKRLKIFFYRICGTGMGAAAVLVRQMGHQVEGFDFTYYPPMSDYLYHENIKTFTANEFSPDLLKNYDLIVVGNAVHRLSEHAQWIESSGVKFTSFPSLLGALVLAPLNVVGICGTHGKTTTTYLATQVFENLGQGPGYLIGAILDGRPPACLPKKSQYFFIEGDEYDTAYFQKFSKFRCYELKSMILTSLEYDHADIFSSLEAIEEEFVPVIRNLKGTFIVGNGYQSCHRLASLYQQNHHEKVLFYGKGTSHGPKILEESPQGTKFELKWNDLNMVLETNVVGAHNIENLSSVCLFALSQGFEVEALKIAVKKLNMPRRRQELRGIYHGALVVDDFAHHPTAVIKTIEAIKSRYPGKKIKIILDPMSATGRSHLFQEAFVDSFKGAESVFIAKPKLKTTVPGGENLDVEKLARDTHEKLKISAQGSSELSELRSWIDRESTSDSLILVLSNNTALGLWESDFVDLLLPVSGG